MADTTRFLKYVWPFYNIMYERVKQLFILKQQFPLTQHLRSQHCCYPRFVRSSQRIFYGCIAYFKKEFNWRLVLFEDTQSNNVRLIHKLYLSLLALKRLIREETYFASKTSLDNSNRV